jgi:hypothetical protein
MNKQKTLALIPLVLVAGLLIYTWTILLFTDAVAIWMHYVALLLFLPLAWLHFKNFKMGLLFTAIYLILGAINLFSLTPAVITSSYGLRIGEAELWSPTFQPISIVLLILYAILNFNAFITIYVDYKVKDDNSVHNP